MRSFEGAICSCSAQTPLTSILISGTKGLACASALGKFKESYSLRERSERPDSPRKRSENRGGQSSSRRDYYPRRSTWFFLVVRFVERLGTRGSLTSS